MELSDLIEPAATDVVSKAEFARRRGVSKARVSQWISDGKIPSEALVGVGRHARIDEAIASQQVELRLDATRRLSRTDVATFAAPVGLDDQAMREIGRQISVLVERKIPTMAASLSQELGASSTIIEAALLRAWRAVCGVST